MRRGDVLAAIIDEYNAALIYHTGILPDRLKRPYFRGRDSTTNKIAERPRHVAVVAVVVLERDIQKLREVGVPTLRGGSRRVDGDPRA